MKLKLKLKKYELNILIIGAFVSLFLGFYSFGGIEKLEEYIEAKKIAKENEKYLTEKKENRLKDLKEDLNTKKNNEEKTEIKEKENMSKDKLETSKQNKEKEELNLETKLNEEKEVSKELEEKEEELNKNTEKEIEKETEKEKETETETEKEIDLSELSDLDKVFLDSSKKEKITEEITEEKEEEEIKTEELKIIDKNELEEEDKNIEVDQKVETESNKTEDDFIEYLVKAGDTWGRLAITYDTTIQNLQEINNKTRLFIGDTIFIPKK
jgi:chemotaxis protein histidine kinase CheA